MSDTDDSIQDPAEETAAAGGKAEKKTGTERLDDAVKELAQLDGSTIGEVIQPGTQATPPQQPPSRRGGTKTQTAPPPVPVTTPRTDVGATPRSATGGSGGPSRLAIGVRLGQIEITGVLGKGGMGEVFRGHHNALDIDVAIKVLPEELSRNEIVRQRFLREARLCVKLDHPNVVRVFNVDEYEGNLYLVMELIEGTDAAAMMKNGGRFPYRRALEIGKAAAEALAYAHSQGLVHRDVKPHNILLSARDARIKLSDFGLARASASHSHLTMSGQIMGTPHYMSPEQAESKEVTDRSDVYSLGISLYHMLTGKTPFVGDTPISVAVQHIAKEVIFPPEMFKAFPKELVAVLRRMTAKDSSKRCSAKQAAIWIDKLLALVTGEDFDAGEEVMRTMAPVLRESMAFEAAAEERRKIDARARERAAQLVATMQEQPRSEHLVATMQEPGGRSQIALAAKSASAEPAKKGGAGLLVAAVVLLAVLGGGGAAWYYLMGPGKAGGNEPGGNDFIAGGNVDGGNGIFANDGSANGAGDGNFSSTDNRQPPANGAPPDNAANNGNGGGTSTDNGHNERIVAEKLGKLDDSLAQATTAADVRKVRDELQAFKPTVLSKGTPGQREEFDLLLQRVEDKLCFLGAKDELKRIHDALEAFKNSGNETVSDLNRAMELREKFADVKLPADEAFAETIRTERDDLFADLDEVFDAKFTALWEKAENLAAERKYGEADKAYTALEKLRLDEERSGQVTSRRSEVYTEGQIAAANAKLSLKDYKGVSDIIDELDEAGVPESLKESFGQLRGSLDAAIEKDLAGFLAAAVSGADEGKFDDARKAIDDAGKLPYLQPEQLVRIAVAKHYVAVAEPLAKAAAALDEKRYGDAAASLKAADGRIDDAGDSADENLVARRDTLREDLKTAIAAEFGVLMKAARDHVAANEFGEAGKKLGEARKLPLDEDQLKELDEFAKSNEKALVEFAADLMDDVKKALDGWDFASARSALDTLAQLSLPAAETEKVTKLEERFRTDADKRFNDLLKAAETAIKGRKYEDARENLEALDGIPVAEALVEKAGAAWTSYYETLKTDVTERLQKVEELADNEKFEEARTELDSAAKLPLTDPLKEVWDEAEAGLNGAIEDKFASYLRRAEKAREDDGFAISKAHLDDASKLPLDAGQKDRLKEAWEDHGKELKAKIDGLFEEAWKAVDRQDEKGVKAAAKELDDLKWALTLKQQEELKTLQQTVRGVTDADREKALPAALKDMFRARYVQSEALFHVGGSVEAVQASSNGKFAIAGTREGTIVVYDLKRMAQRGRVSAGNRRITAVAISPDGDYAACGNDQSKLILFDVTRTSVTVAKSLELSERVSGLVFSNDGETLYVINEDGELQRFNARTKTQIDARAVATGIDKPSAFSLSPNGRYLAIGGDDAEIVVWDLDSMTQKAKLQGPGSDVISGMSFSADGGFLIAGSEDEDVAVWNASTFKKEYAVQLKGLGELVRGAGFSADGRLACAFDNDKSLSIWDPVKGIQHKTYDLSRINLPDRNDPGDTYSLKANCGHITQDGTILIGTREGDLIHMTVRFSR